MLHCPHNRIYNELLVPRRDIEKSLEAMCVDSPDKFKEADSVLREVLKVDSNHLQSAFKDSRHDFWHFTQDMTFKLLDNSCKQHKHLRVSCVRDVALVVAQNRIQNWWDKTLRHCLRICLRRPTLLNKHDEQAKHFLFRTAHRSNETQLSGTRALLSNGRGYAFRVYSVHVQQVHEKCLQLLSIDRSNRPAHLIIRFQDFDNFLYDTWLNQ
mmetsp:Transcript_1805/g.2674  ORF Transcript_1805/g.2674 Transcript_1805/m.2674 type:complete len:211 (-) Transcript_1805:2140-2772(-)